MAQHGQARHGGNLHNPIIAQIQAQQHTEMTQAVHVSDAVALHVFSSIVSEHCIQCDMTYHTTMPFEILLGRFTHLRPVNLTKPNGTTTCATGYDR